jgi:pilus assembly protein CpaC
MDCLPLLAASIALCLAAHAGAQPPAPAAPGKPLALSPAPARIGAEMTLIVGKSALLRLPEAVDRISVANPAIADVTPVSERDLYLLGKDLGNTNVIVWTRGGPATIVDVKVVSDPSSLELELLSLLAGETDIRVRTSADSIVLIGSVSDTVAAAHAVEIAQAWVRRLTRGLVMPIASGGIGGGTVIQVGEARGAAQTARVAGPAVINMLRVRAAQQVMLDVKVAEVSKTLLSRLGISVRMRGTRGDTTFDFLSQSNFFNQLLGSVSAFGAGAAANGLQIDAQRDDGLIKLLAQPNIMAISGQEASFRAGGKIFIPVGRRNDTTGGTAITLEEKEFGVGVKFKPTVLADGRINLQVAPEVSELQQTGTPFTSVDGATSVLPSFTLRRAETTVQLNDGQSFMIAGLVQNNATANINRFPGLGDLPIIGALFRSSEFQADRTELMFVITPRLVKPLPADYVLPTDGYVEPSLGEVHIGGALEGQRAGDARRRDGFELK